MRVAMQGVKRVYFVYPPQGELLVEATTMAAVAGRDAGVDTLVNGETVPDRISRGPTPVDEVLLFFLQIAEGRDNRASMAALLTWILSPRRVATGR